MRSAAGPARGAWALPQPPSHNRGSGPTSKRKGWKGRVRQVEGKGKAGGREVEGRLKGSGRER